MSTPTLDDLRFVAGFVGCCGLRPRDPERRVFELGFHLGFEHWGKALATGSQHPSYVRDRS